MIKPTYDIVEGHGGEFNVDMKEARPDDPVGRGEWIESIIQLPISCKFCWRNARFKFSLRLKKDCLFSF